MSKKSRSRRKASSRTRRAQPQRREQPVGGGSTAESVSKAPPETTDFASEYGYVLSDLKRFAILAAAMLITLAVLALVIG